MSSSVQQYTYWSMTWNNPDDRMMVMIRNPNQKYVRECVWTLEEGEETQTPHIQAWIRLQRNQTLTFMKKIYPGGHFKPCAKDEYSENTHQYAQKNDATTRGQHVITINDPIPSVESLYYRVCERILEHEDWDNRTGVQPWGMYFAKFGANLPKGLLEQIRAMIIEIQLDLVAKERGLEKIFTSFQFEKLQRFLPQTLFRLWSDKQTNKQEEEKVSRLNITTIDANGTPILHGEEQTQQAPSEEDDGEDYEEGSGSEDEGFDESGSSCSSEASSESGYGE